MPDASMTPTPEQLARNVLHSIGIRTERYVSGGADHPMMAPLVQAIREAEAAASQDARRKALEEAAEHFANVAEEVSGSRVSWIAHTLRTLAAQTKDGSDER